MVQQEYQKFKLQSNQTFEQNSTRGDSPCELDFQTAYNDFQMNKNKQNEAESNIPSPQLHNIRSSSYSKKRKILKIVNDPNTKKSIILNLNQASETQKNEIEQNQMDKFEVKQRNIQQNNEYQKKQKEWLQLSELLTTKDIITNCFIPSSNEPRIKKQKYQKFIIQKPNQIGNRKHSQVYEYVGDQDRYSPSPFRLATIDQ